LAFKEIDVLKDKLRGEAVSRGRDSHGVNFEEIIGESAPLKRALAQSNCGARDDVLILGTREGKELLRADSQFEPAAGTNFLKINWRRFRGAANLSCSGMNRAFTGR